MSSTHSAEDEVKESLLFNEDRTSSVEQRGSKTLKRWLIFTSSLAVVFICTTVLLVVRQITSPPCAASTTCKNTFTTEFVSKAPEIEIKIIEKHFTNDLRFNATSKTFFNEELDPTESRYIGPPSPELDAVWHALLQSQYVAISPEEALQFPESSRQIISYYGDHHFFELAVYHNLHCLNELRMALDPEYYSKKPGHENWAGGRIHIDHCIDQLRQAVECHGDLTPVPMLAVEGGPRGLYVGNGEVHTCRDFGKIHGWVQARGKINVALGDKPL